jgi:putative spermidine/putrescine transport system ATP-binding protein
MSADDFSKAATADAGTGLEIRGLSVRYGDVQALRNISLSVRKGELFALVGPSGSGKSTLLLCIAGFVSSASGSISLEGRDITSLPANTREIGMVFQSYTLFPHMTVFENIGYPLRVRRKSEIEVRHRVAEMLTLLHLEDYKHRYPDEISGGQQQRVALARALAFNPNVLLLDEPLGAVDRKLKIELQSEIRRVQRTAQTTLIYVTHDQKEAMALSDRMAVLDEGRILQIGTAREIYDNPRNSYVADFVGGANLLVVDILDGGMQSCDVVLAGSTITGVPRPKWLTDTASRAILMVRPERWILSDGPPQNCNQLPAEIVEVIFEGDSISLRCQLRDQRRIIVRQPVGEREDFCPGDVIYLAPEAHLAKLFELNERN